MKNEQMNKFTKLAAALAIAVAETHAEERRGESTRTADRIVISIPDRKLVLMNGDRAVRIYDVAVGKASTPSPEGDFRVINRIPNPAYYGAGKVVEPGKNNPLGTRWMGLSARGYGIHGTNAPNSIGKAASHGCIRMRQKDLEDLFEMVAVGTVVEIHGERPLLLADLLSAHNGTTSLCASF